MSECYEDRVRELFGRIPALRELKGAARLDAEMAVSDAMADVRADVRADVIDDYIADLYAIADEQIAWWIFQGITAEQAWDSLGIDRRRSVEWWEVRVMLVRWLRYRKLIPAVRRAA